MSVSKISIGNLVEGYQLPAITREITLEDMRIYEGWPKVKNLHTDDDEARKLGLPKALARAHHYLAYATEILCNVFGEHWLKTGKLSVNMMAPAFPGDTLTAAGKITAVTKTEGGTKFELEINVLNQKGEKAVTGTATVRVTV
jgi:acyl dehydratase